MNSIFHLMIIFFAVSVLQQTSCGQGAEASAELIPLAVGNEWIYRDSIFENDKLTMIKMDTDRIMSASVFNGGATYHFSDGREVMLSGDTLFELVRQRSGVKFTTPSIIAAETETRFNYAFGGDVLKPRTVKKSICAPNSLGAERCYIMTDDCGNETLIGHGIGIFREKKVQCGALPGDFMIRTLIGLKLKK